MARGRLSSNALASLRRRLLSVDAAKRFAEDAKAVVLRSARDSQLSPEFFLLIALIVILMIFPD